MTSPPDARPADTYLSRLFDPRVRGYLVTVGAALAVVFVALFQRGQLTAAVFPVLLAVAGLLLGRTAVPGFVVAVVGYLLVYPTGIPFDGYGYADVRSSYFVATDLMFVPAVLCYLAAQYRLFGLTVRAVPDDRPKHLQKPTDTQPRRPADGIRPTELQWLFAGIAGAVLAGQLLWLALTRLELDPAAFPPVRAADGGASSRGSRFILFVGLTAAVGIAARLVFWYWRLAGLNAQEARLTLVDAGWSEVRREAARQETWRAWGRPGRKRESGVSLWEWVGGSFSVLLAVTLAAVGIGLVLFMVWTVYNTR